MLSFESATSLVESNQRANSNGAAVCAQPCARVAAKTSIHRVGFSPPNASRCVTPSDGGPRPTLRFEFATSRQLVGLASAHRTHHARAHAMVSIRRARAARSEALVDVSTPSMRLRRCSGYASRAVIHPLGASVFKWCGARELADRSTTTPANSEELPARSAADLRGSTSQFIAAHPCPLGGNANLVELRLGACALQCALVNKSQQLILCAS